MALEIKLGNIHFNLNFKLPNSTTMICMYNKILIDPPGWLTSEVNLFGELCNFQC